MHRILSPRAGLAALALLGGVAAVQAEPIALSRVTVTTIAPSGSGFASSTVHYANTFELDASGGTALYNVGLRTAWTNLAIGATGGASATYVPSPPLPGANVAPVQVDAAATTGQAWSFSYDAPATTTGFGTSFLQLGEAGGYQVLNFSGGGTDFLAEGGSFLSVVRILGDWSDLARHTAASFNAAFTVQDNFVFDSLMGYTTFSVYDDSYSLQTNPNIAFSLIGEPVAASVPEPSSLLLAGLGIALLGRVRRFRAG